MSLLQGRSFVVLCMVAASSMPVAFAKQVNVSTATELTSATLNAKAGDTIWVASGKYELPSSNCQNDKFVNETGRDCGRIWLGADGTKNNPIVLAGSDPANPPEIYGTAVNSNYGIHVTGNYVILKNLKIHTFSKGVVFDNSVGALMEDCEVYHTGTELVHVRDSSQQVTLNRNFIHGSGYETAQYGEGIYVGTYYKSWASSQQSDKTAGFWGESASQHRYSGYDWRVNDTKITCNIVKATTAENIDVKEGTIRGIVQGNMFIADSTNYDGKVDYDDANIDMKGASWSVTGNYFYNSKKSGLPYYNSHFRYFVEEVVMSGTNISKYETAVGYPVSADAYAQTGWCDNSSTDKNDCVESKNHVVEEIVDVRNNHNKCPELFKIPESSIAYSSSFTPPSSSSVSESSSSVSISSSSSATISSSGSTSYETVRYEAEDATCAGSGCETKTHKDASGGKYVLTKNDGNITFNVNVPTAGTYTVTIRYNNSASNAKTQDIYVNGTKVKSQEFPVTLGGNVGGANAAFEDMPVQVSLKAGDNTFAINKSWGYVDIDYIAIDVPVSSETTIQTVRYEAEDATCVGSGCETKSHKDASGGKYVLTKNDGNITFNVNVPSAGTYTVTIRYNNSANNAKTQDIYVNGTKVKSQEFPVTLEGNVGGANAAFEDMPVQVSLKAGANAFAINKSWGYVDIDYIEVAVPNQSAPVSSSATSPTTSSSVQPASSASATAIPSIAANVPLFRAYAAGKSIHLEGVQLGQAFAVLDMQGRVLRSGRVPASGLSVRVDRPGVYLVKVGTSVRTVKVL